jgi:hypothetical protein
MEESPVRSTAPDRTVVKQTYVRQYEPLPKSLRAPAACDWIGYLRYRHREAPTRRSEADAVLVGMPGYLGGASLYDTVARNVVREADARGSYVEFWALDRRANCLEDHTGVDASARVRDYRPALGYYFGNRAVGGRRFAGFRASDDVPYLAEFGLAQTMRDEYAVLRRGIGSQRLRRRKVFCGGHSLGGSLTGAFASWDFDGNPTTTADAGYNQCAGYFGLDTVVSNNLGGISKTGGLKGDALYAAETEGIRSGAAPRFAASTPPVTPELFEVTGIAGLAAYHQPLEPGLLKELPHTRNIDLALRLLLSRNAAAFTTGIPNPRDYRLTNDALLGTLADDNSQSIAGLQASLGTYDGGPVVEKDFPAPNTIKNLPFLGPELGNALAATLILPGGSATKLMIPATPKGPLYRWRNYDRLGARGAPRQVDGLGRPFTTPRSEVTDIGQFARSLFEGPADAWEQYFPTRLIADDGAFLTGGRSGDLRAVRHEDGPQRRPYLEIIASEGVVNYADQTPIEPGAKPRERVVLRGYNHIDVSTAARRQNDGKAEGSSVSLTCFAIRVIDQVPPPDCKSIARRRCLARRSPIGPRNIGRIRLGYTRRRLLRLRVKPVRRTRRSYRYCVKDRTGRVTAIFSSRSRRGRVRLVTTTALGHGNRRVRVRSKAARFRHAYPNRRRIGRGLYRANPKSPRIFGIRRGRVRFIAVASRKLLKNRRVLRRDLRRAGL